MKPYLYLVPQRVYEYASSKRHSVIVVTLFTLHQCEVAGNCESNLPRGSIFVLSVQFKSPCRFNSCPTHFLQPAAERIAIYHK